METSAPQVTIDVTIGQQVISATPTAEPSLFEISEVDQSVTYLGSPLSIFGYGAPGSKILINGIGVSGQVMSDENGFFRFDSIYSLTYLYPEICIYAVDSQNRINFPVCIPQIPDDRSIPSTVGPVLLSPTIGTDKNNITVGEAAVASGFSIPETTLKIHLAKNEDPKGIIDIVNAYYVPVYEVETDSKGYYEFSLPTADQSSYRLFAAGNVGDYGLPKSITLTFTVFSRSESYWRSLINLFSQGPGNIIIFLEIIIVIILTYLLSKSTTKPRRANSKVDKIRQKYLKLLKERIIT